VSEAPSTATDSAVSGGTPEQTTFGKLLVLMITAFIDMLGLLMILPLLPFYAKSLGAGGFVVGLLVSAFSVARAAVPSAPQANTAASSFLSWPNTPIPLRPRLCR